jgi:hypothetical protein
MGFGFFTYFDFLANAFSRQLDKLGSTPGRNFFNPKDPSSAHEIQ